MAVVTKTLKSSGGDYSLMSTWESTEQTDLVSAGDSHVLECYNDWPSGLNDNVTIDGWTTGASNTITIKAADGEEHNGVAGAGFLIKANINYNSTITVAVSYVSIQDIEVVNNGTISANAVYNYGSNGLCERVIVSHAETGIVLGHSTSVARNCLCYNISGNGFEANNWVSPVFYNCTAVDCAGYGFAKSTNGAPVVINCAAYNSTNADFYPSGWGGTSDYNAGSDTSSPGSNSVDSITSAVFTDYSGGDYSVAGTGSALYDAGTDLSGTFTDDIAGTTRSTWDIGAYEYVSVGGGATPKGPLGHPLHGPFGGPV